MRSNLCAGLVSLSLVSALQIPLLGSLSPPRLDFSRHQLEISSPSLQNDIKIDNLLKRAKALEKIADEGIDEYNHPTRVIGSKGHKATLNYIYKELSDMGDYYAISNQTFPAVSGYVLEDRLVVGNKVLVTAQPMALTPATKNREPVFGQVVFVDNGGCKDSDFPPEVKGNIVLFQRGSCFFSNMSQNAGKAGAVAALIYNKNPGVLRGTLGVPQENHIATFAISSEDALPMVERLKAKKPLDAIAYIDAVIDKFETVNIIAQTKGGDPDNCVMLGGHSDSVSEGPGINDDGSGSMAILEIASQLTKYEVNNCVRFVWWAGEEEGLLGSNYYITSLSPSENHKIRMFMDYDMLASPNYAYQVYNASNELNPVGSAELRILFEDWFDNHGIPYMYIAFDGRSDYVGFITNGIPGGGIATGAEGIKTPEQQELFGGEAGAWYDPCYHEACDTVENLALDAWEINTKLIAHSVATYARSLKGFPERKAVDVQAQAVDSATASIEAGMVYRGSRLVI